MGVLEVQSIPRTCPNGCYGMRVRTKAWYWFSAQFLYLIRRIPKESGRSTAFDRMFRCRSGTNSTARPGSVQDTDLRDMVWTYKYACKTHSYTLTGGCGVCPQCLDLKKPLSCPRPTHVLRSSKNHWTTHVQFLLRLLSGQDGRFCRSRPFFY